MIFQTLLRSLEELHQVTKKLAPLLESKDILLLKGDLGVGKTEFARSLIRHLTQKEQLEVPSPTFTLLQIYESPLGPLSHIDLYRLEDPSEARELGLQEIFSEGISLIEWPERLPSKTYPNPLEISFTFPESGVERHLKMTSTSSQWITRLKGFS